jgi:hypothetical protein
MPRCDKRLEFERLRSLTYGADRNVTIIIIILLDNALVTMGC